VWSGTAIETGGDSREFFEELQRAQMLVIVDAPPGTTSPASGVVRMSEDRAILPSLQYWTASQDRILQRFYVAFCLLVSAIQDAMLGLREMELETLNWSATCSYYSLVHQGRFLAFLGIGDFPKSHERLGRLYRGDSAPVTGRDGMPFDWLSRFARVGGTEALARRSWDQYLDIVRRYLVALDIDDVPTRLTSFSQTLSVAKELRNDSNYEGLLIAHEYDHPIVTPAFRSLANAMGEAAQMTLPLVVGAFMAYVDRDAELDRERDAVRAFVHDYAQRRIMDSIRPKLAGSWPLERRLLLLVQQLRSSNRPSVDYRSIETSVGLGDFGEKSALMHDFRTRIALLDQATQGQTRGPSGPMP